MERHLAAILSADAVGYSRLMAEDEEGTARTLAACRHLISDLVGQRGGRVVDAPGDNVLAEFPSVVDAVRCAVEIQEELARRKMQSEVARVVAREIETVSDARRQRPRRCGAPPSSSISCRISSALARA